MLKKIKQYDKYRSGTLIKFADMIHELCDLTHDKDIMMVKDEDVRYNPQVIEKMINLLHDIHDWNITTYGNLYLTAGGRIVLDKGYGEHFGDGDAVLYNLNELTSGIRFDDFVAKVMRAINNHNKADEFKPRVEKVIKNQKNETNN